MTATSILQRNPRPMRRNTATHLFAVGQSVRLKGGSGRPAFLGNIYTSPAHSRRGGIHRNTVSATTKSVMSG